MHRWARRPGFAPADLPQLAAIEAVAPGQQDAFHGSLAGALFGADQAGENAGGVGQLHGSQRLQLFGDLLTNGGKR